MGGSQCAGHFANETSIPFNSQQLHRAGLLGPKLYKWGSRLHNASDITQLGSLGTQIQTHTPGSSAHTPNHCPQPSGEIKSSQETGKITPSLLSSWSCCEGKIRLSFGKINVMHQCELDLLWSFLHMFRNAPFFPHVSPSPMEFWCTYPLERKWHSSLLLLSIILMKKNLRKQNLNAFMLIIWLIRRF